MKKSFVLLCLILFSLSVFPQDLRSTKAEDKLFYEGKSLYYDKNYAGCLDKMRAYRKLAVDTDLKREADFFIAASAYYSGEKGALDLLNAYLDTYPETNHRDEVSFMIGSLYFSNGKYDLASFWLGKANIDNLSTENQEEYAYRMAYSCMNVKKKKEEAYRLFGLLMRNSKKYKNAATYYSGYLYYSDGDYGNALDYFNQVRNVKEFNPDVLYYITQIYFLKKDYAHTIKEGTYLLQTYRNDDKYNTEISRAVGASCFYTGDYSSAVRYLNQYVQQTETPQAGDFYMLGMSYYRIKEYRYAVYYFKRSNPGKDALGQNTDVYMGQSYLKLGEDNNATVSFETASRMDFDPLAKEIAMYNYAMLLHKNSVSGFGESISVLEKFLNTYPHSVYADNVESCLADVYLSSKNDQAALNSIARIKDPAPKILQAKQKIYYHLGTVSFTNSDFHAAVGYFNSAIREGDYAKAEKNESYYWRGESYYRLASYDEAIRDYKTFLASGEGGGEELKRLAAYNLGYCYFKKKQYTEAKPYFETFIAGEKTKDAALSDAYARLGDCLFYSRNFADADAAYSKASEILPSKGDYAVFQKGFLLGLQKDYNGKIAQMDRLIDQYPDSRYVPDALYEKGRACVMLGNDAQAVNVYTQLIRQYPENENSRKASVQLAQLYYNENQLSKALSAYKYVIKTYPGSDEAKVAMQDLKSVYMDLNDVQAYADYAKTVGNSYAISTDEQDSLTYLSAEKYFMKNDFKSAKETLNKYLQQYPSGNFSTDAYYYLGEIYYNEKDYPRALDAYSNLKDRTSDPSKTLTALQGMVRSAYRSGKFKEAVKYASEWIGNSSFDPGTRNEAMYFRALSNLRLDEKVAALEDLKSLSADTRTSYGAEAEYLLAQVYFDLGQTAKSEAEVTDYIRKGTPYPYWLAKSYILLSDIYVKKRDKVSARQYLESLQHNYKNTNDDIHSIIKERLSKL